MKQRILICISILLCLAVLFGCAADTAVRMENSSTGYAMAPEVYAKDTMEIGDMENAQIVTRTDLPLDDRKLIQNLSVTLETKDYPAAIAALEALVGKLNGYVQNSSISGISSTQPSRQVGRRAFYLLRIPQTHLNDALTDLREIGNITNYSENVDDVTDTYYDIEAHLTAYEAQEKRLLELMEQAKDLDDVLKLESSLADVRYRIESLTAQVRRYDNLIAYATIEVTVSEVISYTVSPSTLGERIRKAFADSLQSLRTGSASLLVWLVGAAPYLLILLVLLIVLLLLLRKRRKKKAAVKAASTPSAPPAQND